MSGKRARSIFDFFEGDESHSSSSPSLLLFLPNAPPDLRIRAKRARRIDGVKQQDQQHQDRVESEPQRRSLRRCRCFDIVVVVVVVVKAWPAAPASSPLVFFFFFFFYFSAAFFFFDRPRRRRSGYGKVS